MVIPTRLERLDDEALVTALALDAPGAAAAFVRRFQRRVYGLAVTISNDASTGEDIAQQAFVKAWRAAGSYDARRGSVLTWPLAITRNVAIDAVRVRRPGPVDPTLLAELVPPSTDVAPETSAETADELTRIHADLARLPVDQRRAVLLAAVAGRTAAEIAEQEHIPLGTAKTRIRSGLRKLRAAQERRR
jgi:RNA polymerase sigma-70 factor (ECF subfamily)